jgi:4'-phosphopantetheinyl transferase
MTLASEYKRKRIKRYHNFIDSQRVLVADVLLRQVLCSKLGIKNRDLIFYFNECGKPFLKNSDIHFNISHSGEWIVCAVSYCRVGIDIEQIKLIDFVSIASSFFSDIELQDLMEIEETSRLFYFYDLWTLKESYIKAVGKGLSIPLNSFTVRKNCNSIILRNEKESATYFFKQYSLDSNYILSICSSNSEYPTGIIIKKIDDILENLD